MDKIKIAILDFYDGQPADTINKLNSILDYEMKKNQMSYNLKLFDVRKKNEIPGLDFHIYFSTGGPGSPFDGKNQKWESKFFNFLDNIYSFNQNNREKNIYLVFVIPFN